MQHNWLEYLSSISNAVMAMAAIFALVQVWAALRSVRTSLHQTSILVEQLGVATAQLELSTSDIEIRFKREALSLALQECKRFAEIIVPHFNEIMKQMLQLKYPVQAKLPNPDFPFISQEEDPLGAEIWDKHVELRIKIINALNELESFAMYFTLDLADESAAFTPAAATFCFTCEFYRLFIGAFRPDDKIKLYQNIVKLYSMWKPRLEHTVLDQKMKLLQKEKQNLPVNKTNDPIGTKVR